MRSNPYDASNVSRANIRTLALTCASLCIGVVVLFCAMAAALQPHRSPGFNPLPALRWDDIPSPGDSR